MHGLLCSPPFLPVYLCTSVGPRGTTHRSACSILHHSECGPLGLSARMWGHRVCQWSDCLPCSSHTLPVSVLPQQHKSSLPRLPISASPTGLDECLFFISLASDFLSIRFSVSSGSPVHSYKMFISFIYVNFQQLLTYCLIL